MPAHRGNDGLSPLAPSNPFEIGCGCSWSCCAARPSLECGTFSHHFEQWEYSRRRVGRIYPDCGMGGGRMPCPGRRCGQCGWMDHENKCRLGSCRNVRKS